MLELLRCWPALPHHIYMTLGVIAGPNGTSGLRNAIISSAVDSETEFRRRALLM
jgi:hypothetical protein